MIVAKGLTKRYGRTLAVDNLSFEVTPGVVTGFLGPNGSGKSTTMRMIMALDNPTSGTTLVNGKPYADLAWPLREVRALLDAKASRASITCTERGGWLRVVVRDDGTGGASLSRVGSSSSGLVGLTDRVHAVDGRLTTVSPPWGPTVVTVDLPLHA
jgi:ABC-2 type transport system ATP-binding protein